MIQALGHDLFAQVLYTPTVVLVPFSQYFVLYTEIPSLRGLLCCQLTTDKKDHICSTFYFTKFRVMTNCVHPRNTDFVIAAIQML